MSDHGNSRAVGRTGRSAPTASQGSEGERGGPASRKPRARHRPELVVLHVRFRHGYGEPRGSNGRSLQGPCRAYADLSLEVKLASRQLHYLVVNTVRGKARTHVRSAEKRHGIAAWKRIKTENQPEAADRPTAMLMEVMQPGWDSRGVTNNC